MSKTQAIYSNYVENWKAQHPNLVEPTIVDSFKEARSLADFGRTVGILKTVCSKYWSGGSCCDQAVYVVPDGRVLEVGWFMQGLMPKVAVFENEKQYSEYDQPMSPNTYFERW